MEEKNYTVLLRKGKQDGAGSPVNNVTPNADCLHTH